MSKLNDFNSQQSWRDRFLQKIIRGISTFSFIPLVASIIAPMITFFLPVAYSIYYLLGIPSTEVMQGVLDFGGEILFELIMNTFLIGIYFIGTGILVLSIFTMAKKRKKGQYNLIQHGIYARIRHPQNFAICLILFSVFIMWDSLIFYGLETGHIISWSTFTLFLQLESLIEEKKLLKQFPDQYWAYVQNTGFFHFRLRNKKPISPKLPESESKYFRNRIILSVFTFIISYLIVFSTVKILKINNSELLKFSNPLDQGGGFYPDFHIFNEIMVVLVPIGIWLVSFIITIAHYLKGKGNKNKSESNETEKEQSLIFSKLRAFLFWIFSIFLLVGGLLNIVILRNYWDRMLG
jgi:protein-S-isoprenylcysteine O-methyltransferase Ste14